MEEDDININASVIPIEPGEPGRICFVTDGIERLAIEGDGRLVWNGRAIETDDDLRTAMLELRARFLGLKTNYDDLPNVTLEP